MYKNDYVKIRYKNNLPKLHSNVCIKINKTKFYTLNNK